MTRRERMERRLALRREWADKAASRSEDRFEAAHAISDKIPMGQPILVGHHSERHARRDIARIDANMSKGVEEHKLAERHTSKADNIERALDRTIYDDDPDAIERLEARIKEREESAEMAVRINKAYRKGGMEAVRGLVGDTAAERMAHVMSLAPWLKAPCSTTGIRTSIRADKERIEAIRTRRTRAEKAAEAPNGVLVEGGEFVRVTFPEKPAREVLTRLRSAGFYWGSGSWHGPRNRLPADLS